MTKKEKTRARYPCHAWTRRPSYGKALPSLYHLFFAILFFIDNFPKKIRETEGSLNLFLIRVIRGYGLLIISEYIDGR